MLPNSYANDFIYPTYYQAVPYKGGKESQYEVLLRDLLKAKDFPKLQRAARAPFDSFDEHLVGLGKKFNFFDAWTDNVYHTYMPNSFSQYSALKPVYIKFMFSLTQSPVIKFDRLLMSSLSKTDISLLIPVELARPAYGLTYLAFEDFPGKPQIRNAKDGTIREFEGAYVAWSNSESGHSYLEILMVGKGFSKPGDYDFSFARLPAANPEGKFNFSQVVAAFESKTSLKQLSDDAPVITAEHLKSLNNGEAYLCVFQALCFLNSKVKQQECSRDLDAAIEQAGRLLNSVKRQKALRQAYRQSNQIIIRGKDFGLDDDHDSEGNSLISKSVHWRRGHFRNAAVGPGRQEAKVVWVRPTLVNREKLAPGEEAPAVKEYLVTQ